MIGTLNAKMKRAGVLLYANSGELTCLSVYAVYKGLCCMSTRCRGPRKSRLFMADSKDLDKTA